MRRPEDKQEDIMTKTEQVERILRKARKPLGSREIAELSGVNWNTVRGILVRLRRGGKVKKADRFLYRYASQKAQSVRRGHGSRGVSNE